MSAGGWKTTTTKTTAKTKLTNQTKPNQIELKDNNNNKKQSLILTIGGDSLKSIASLLGVTWLLRLISRKKARTKTHFRPTYSVADRGTSLRSETHWKLFLYLDYRSYFEADWSKLLQCFERKKKKKTTVLEIQKKSLNQTSLLTPLKKPTYASKYSHKIITSTSRAGSCSHRPNVHPLATIWSLHNVVFLIAATLYTPNYNKVIN